MRNRESQMCHVQNVYHTRRNVANDKHNNNCEQSCSNFDVFYIDQRLVPPKVSDHVAMCFDNLVNLEIAKKDNAERNSHYQSSKGQRVRDISTEQEMTDAFSDLILVRRPPDDWCERQDEGDEPRDRKNPKGIAVGEDSIVFPSFHNLKIPVYTDCTERKQRGSAQKHSQKTVQFAQRLPKDPLSFVNDGC